MLVRDQTKEKNRRKIVGEFILEKRLSIGYTQTNLAYYLGVSGPEISQYERGVRSPGLVTFFKIAKYLKAEKEIGKLLDDILAC